MAGYTHQNRRGPNASPRTLMRWNEDAVEEMLLCIEYVLCERDIATDILTDAGQLMSGTKPTANAIQQACVKLRKKRIAAGKAPVPQHKVRGPLHLPATPQSAERDYDGGLSGSGSFVPATEQDASMLSPLPEKKKRKRAVTAHGSDNYVVATVDDTMTPAAYTAPPIPQPPPFSFPQQQQQQQQGAFPAPLPQQDFSAFSFPAADPFSSGALFTNAWAPEATINPAETTNDWQGERYGLSLPPPIPAGPGPAYQGNNGEQGDFLGGGEMIPGGFGGGEMGFGGFGEGEMDSGGLGGGEMGLGNDPFPKGFDYM